jgi:alpha-L-fucosidase 2
MKYVLPVVACLFYAVSVYSQAPVLKQLDEYDVDWNSPGPNSAASMPLGNGDIGLNVWVDPGGDLLFYVSKTDAWGGEKDATNDEWMQTGGVLMKLGLIRVATSPNPLAANPIATFHQLLHLHDGEITITEGEGSAAIHYRIWVDANHPVIRIEASSDRPLKTTVTLHDWRLQAGDTILSTAKDNSAEAATADRITWNHHNPGIGDPRLADPHLADICFGGTIQGNALTRTNDTTLQTATAKTTQFISISALTTKAPLWRSTLDRQTASIERLDLETTRRAHRQWWDQFWSRSYIFLHGNGQGRTNSDATANTRNEATANTRNDATTGTHNDATTDSVTRGYLLQRFVTACAGRGAYPIKFNGSIFVVDDPLHRSDEKPAPVNADFRAWGGQYWFQNTRPMYWPRLAAGDFDMMLPLFNMYLNMLPENSAEVTKYYGHDGAYFQETTPFWGTLPFVPPSAEALYTHHYFTPILELSMMMLDYFNYTADDRFARKYLLPIASAGLEFFDRHFPRDGAGHLLLDPDNAIEMYWKVHDPSPDIAGLRAVLTRMLDLPPGLISGAQKQQWRQLLSILPPLPIDSSNGAPRLLPYTGPQTAERRNEENPELYAVYPFRLYGLGEPNLALARHSFDIRKCPQEGCWSQDPIQAAMLGYTDIAKEDVRFNLTNKAASLKFPAFWDKGHDYLPDQDNGGNGENGLQQMLLQAVGHKILLLPAWPADWDCDFKLHAPYLTTVEGKVRHGHIMDLIVTPAIRRQDIIDCSLPANNKLIYDIQSSPTN